MTFSICVHETYENEDGATQDRFGVAVTTRLPGVGTLCPFVSENGAVATQSMVNVELGRKGIEYVDDGLAVEDALESLLNADDGKPERQLHGVDRNGTFAFSGSECHGWYGEVTGENYTVAGNLLTGASVVEAVAETYEQSDRTRPLAERLIDALAAGQAEGGDKRETLTVQSAALKVATTEDEENAPDYGNDLRVDASESPVRELRETYRMATTEFAKAAERYEREE
ncbi:DUF1028 domain-containing protein [Halarchaeum sp. P4]|uniref:DUF1028 domain-containing protein n=1 Tax=Halarchaeum sp. P4 TaxID=3421639 RepID=UPI003EBC826C